MRIYINGKIHTMDNVNHICTALAEDNGRIIDTGDSCETAKKYAGAEITDLGGRTVIPGLIDTHTHLFAAAYSERSHELFIPESVEELLENLRMRTESAGKGEWIVYKNTYPLRLSELRYPTKDELDEVAPENPVIVDGFYSASVNSRALEAINEEELPEEGKMLRNGDGSYSGIIICSYPYLSKFFFEGNGDKEKSLKKLIGSYNRCGITTVIDAKTMPSDIELMRKLNKGGEQNIRARYTMLSEEAVKRGRLELEEADGDMARICYLKDFIDGGFLTGTAYMDYPYKNAEKVFGLECGKKAFGLACYGLDEITQRIELAGKLGLQYCAHTVGSRATKLLISAYKKSAEGKPASDKRNAVIHGDFIDGDDVKDINELGLCALFQPAWHYMDAPSIETVVDEKEKSRFMDYKAITSCRLACAGSDHMVKHDPNKSVNPYNPFTGMYSMITCRARDGKKYGKFTLSREDALAYYTRKAAYATFDEKSIGTLEIGKRADFAVLDNDYFSCPEEEIPNIRAYMTVLNGRRVI